MSVNIRYPNITGLSEKEQLAQIKSYLHQLVEQLNYALPTLDTVGGASTYETQGGEVSYYELQSMIIDATNKLKNEYERLYNRLEKDYVGKGAFEDLVADLEALEKDLPNNYLATSDFTDYKEAVEEDLQGIQDALTQAQQDIDALEEEVAGLAEGGSDGVGIVSITITEV